MNYKDNKEKEHHMNDEEIKRILVRAMDELYLSSLMEVYPPVFFELEGVSRVLGPEHSLTRLMEEAAESLDVEKLSTAQAAFYALPEHVLDQIYHPWIGCPPPPGTREKLIANLVGEADDADLVGCYLQIDADEGHLDCPNWPADGDGHVVDPTLVYDLREDIGWPVRVQIVEGSDKELVVDLLKKIAKTLEKDWDKLTDPDSYSSIFPEDDLPEGWSKGSTEASGECTG